MLLTRIPYTVASQFANQTLMPVQQVNLARVKVKIPTVLFRYSKFFTYSQVCLYRCKPFFILKPVRVLVYSIGSEVYIFKASIL